MLIRRKGIASNPGGQRSQNFKTPFKARFCAASGALVYGFGCGVSSFCGLAWNGVLPGHCCSTFLMGFQREPEQAKPNKELHKRISLEFRKGSTSVVTTCRACPFCLTFSGLFIDLT